MIRKVVANNILLDEAVEHIAAGEDVEIPTKGSSMLPFIVGGKDTLILTAAPRVEVGDIVLAKINNTTYVVHRIIAIEGRKVTLMGDGNIKGCEHCTTEQIYAKVKAVIHNGKKVEFDTARHRRQARLWRGLLPLRRIILGVWRRTPYWPM